MRALMIGFLARSLGACATMQPGKPIDAHTRTLPDGKTQQSIVANGVEFDGKGGEPGRLNCSHEITTDQLGHLYLADSFAGRLQEFEPIPGAEPEKIAGQILRTWDTWKRP